MQQPSLENKEELKQYLMELENSITLASTLFYDLDALFTAISKESEDYSQAKKLSSIGQHLSRDFSNTFDCQSQAIKELREGLANG